MKTKMLKMKWFILSAVLLLGITGIAMSQMKPEVPQAVKDAFAQKYPSATKVKWEAEEAEYEAEFHIAKHEMSAVFQADGTWLETETEIKVSALPAVVQTAITSRFPNAKVKEAEQLESPNSAMVYEVEIKDNGKEMKAVFGADGTFLKMDQESDDDDDDDNG